MKRSLQIKKRIWAAFGILVLWGLVPMETSAFHLSEKSQISLITCAPGNEAYSVYGHSAIRVKDAAYQYDLVFNYGIFDFNAPNFLYRFASGQTDYLLGAYKFENFVAEYKRDKRNVYEQVLNLSQSEKQKIFDFLAWNAKPENRVYRYNFFFDNCATRVRDVIAENIEGGLTFNEQKQSHKTLRQLVEDYHGKLLWLTFGIDLVVSSESDREATFWEEMLLPDYLMNHFAEATKTNDSIPLVKHSAAIFKAPVQASSSIKLLSPFVVFFVLTILLLTISFGQFRRGEMKNRLDYLIYGVTGLMGLVMAWLAIYSEHPAMSPNYNLLWAVPVNFVFAFAIMNKKWRPYLKGYHILISVWLVLFLVVSAFLPQKFHPVFYLFVFMVLSRSIFHSLLLFQKEK